jgi:F0F1-type ATP synthase delta subunit
VRPTTQIRPASGSALTAVEDYFKGMVNVVDSQKQTKLPPKFFPGSAGAQAMRLWQKVYEGAGDAGLARAEKEFDIFVWSVRGKQLWKFLVQTPDAFVDRDRKIALVREHLTSMGCTPLFIDLMIELFNTDDITSLEQIRQDFNAINREHRREVDVELVTGSQLDADTLEYYKASISLNYLKEGDNMIFSHSVDSNIKSGYRVSVKGKLHDFTHNAPRDAFFASLKNAHQAEERRIAGTMKFPNYFPDPTPEQLKDFDYGLFPDWKDVKWNPLLNPSYPDLSKFGLERLN